MTATIKGIHHITAMASDPQRNIDFYTRVLGQRLVKRTVNFDDPGTYHLYYGDKVGNPGTIMTFFPWPHAKRGTLGNGEVVAIAYAIRPESVEYWWERLAQFDVEVTQETRFGQTVMVFKDPDGITLELITDEEAELPQHWDTGPIPAEHALRGFHGVTIWVEQSEYSALLLTEVFSYTLVAQEGERQRYGAVSDEVGLYVDLVARPGQPAGKMGAGSVHHIAFRTPDEAEQLEWQREISNVGFGVTPVRDRQYFQSIYFREPSGVLYEIATDTPGFPADEAVETLGQELKLPAWLEPRRPQIEQRLIPIKVPEFNHV
jgi:glyoxalase family protein